MAPQGAGMFAAVTCWLNRSLPLGMLSHRAHTRARSPAHRLPPAVSTARELPLAVSTHVLSALYLG